MNLSSFASVFADHTNTLHFAVSVCVYIPLCVILANAESFF